MEKIKNYIASKREVWIFIPVYFVLALIQVKTKLFLTTTWLDGTLIRNHNMLLGFIYTNNEQSRVLQYYIPEFFRNLFSLSVPDAYILQRLVFVTLAFILFHFFLRKWFLPPASFAGVLFLAAVMPLSYINYLQESSSLLLVTFLLGLWAIRENKDIWLAAVLLIGGLNNETMLILPAGYFFYRCREVSFKGVSMLLMRTLIISLPALLAMGFIRYLTRANAHLGGALHLYKNLYGIKEQIVLVLLNPLHFYKYIYFFIFLIFGFFWVYAFMRYKEKPLFLRRVGLIIPLFIIIHMLTGVIFEVRQMLPLSFLIIPMAFFYIFPSKEGIN
ncbi:MAG: hypothetical protein ABIH00_07380 [Armatimonadota bacterium]